MSEDIWSKKRKKSLLWAKSAPMDVKQYRLGLLRAVLLGLILVVVICDFILTAVK